jgi:prephenate dehydrogenase
MSFGTVAILGPGLIGGSLALALAERNLADKLVIYARTDKSFSTIKEKLPKAELTTNAVNAVKGADIVIFCVPIEVMFSLAQEIRDVVKPNALVTDVGSVKYSVDRDLELLLGSRSLWIGSHPMAGSDQAGFSVARADLFEGAAVVVTPTNQTRKEAEHRVEEFWKKLGARVFSLSPKDHDSYVAQISHVPHLLAAALVCHASPEARKLAGGGFRDTTRVASGSPDLWTEILSANAKSVAAELGALIVHLKAIKSHLEESPEVILKRSLHATLQAAQDARSYMAETNPLFKKRS